jgi:hypothetical protein
MRLRIILILFVLFSNNIYAQIKTKTITIADSDSSQIHLIKEYYSPTKFLYLSEEIDNIGVFRINRYSKPSNEIQIDSLFEVNEDGEMELKQVVTHHYDKYKNEVRTERHYILENVMHTEKFYYNYSPDGHLMVSGAYDDNNDSLIIYLDSLTYNSKGQLVQKLTYWEGAEEPSGGELYTYYEIGQPLTTSIIDENGELVSVIELTYEKAQVRRKKRIAYTPEGTYTELENFYYNPRGDCILHTETPSEMGWLYKMSYTYYD